MKTKIWLGVIVIVYLTGLSYGLFKLELVLLAGQVFGILIATIMGALAWLGLIEKDEVKKRQDKSFETFEKVDVVEEEVISIEKLKEKNTV